MTESLPAAEAKKLPRDVSGIRLGRLAVARDHQRQSLGKILLIAAMQKFIEIFNSAGGIGFFVDAKDQEAKSYYEQFGFVPLLSNDLELFLPVKTNPGSIGFLKPGRRLEDSPVPWAIIASSFQDFILRSRAVRCV